MRAILLAAGLGTRLRPLTNDIPKCRVPINGEPLLGIWLARLSANGVGPFLVNTHYFSRKVENFIEQCNFSEKITTIYEPELLGTAGTLLKNINFFNGEDGLLIHADNYCLENFERFLNAHQNRPAGCLMTMMTFITDDPRSCGIVELNEQNVVTKFHEKVASPPGNLANGAIYILSSQLLDQLKTKFSSAVDFSADVLPLLLGKIYAYKSQTGVIDIGTPESYRKANTLNGAIN